MIMLERTIRLTAASIGLCAALGSPVARANSGLELKLLDGSIAVNQPDLFAWGNGSQFCAALQSIIAQTGNKNGSVSSCQASPYGNTGVVSAGSLAAHLEFTAMVTLQGSAPFYQKTCAFVDTINLIAQDTLSISETRPARTRPEITRWVSRILPPHGCRPQPATSASRATRWLMHFNPTRIRSRAT